MPKRISASRKMIRDYILATTPSSHREELPASFFEYIPQLYKALYMPSYVHAYSVATEYMRSWFLRPFPENYFKQPPFINGKHIMDDWKHFNRYNIKREKPMAAIVPTVNYDYDAENLDSYMADKSLLLRRSVHQQSFFKDYRNKNFIYLQMREIEMNFGFKVRVNTRSEQLDLYNKMEIWFRIGATQTEYLSVDFHIPYEIMLNVAERANFKIHESTGMIIDLDEFMQYLNANSSIPIIYKMRAVNQRPEFFLRAKSIRAHISTRDKLQLDDGERNGQLDENFHVEMAAVLRMTIPYFYAYMSQSSIVHTIPTYDRKEVWPLYSINLMEFPPENEVGWKCIAVAPYLCEEGEERLDLTQIFKGKPWPVTRVLEYNMKLGITPESFLDVQVYHENDVAKKVYCHVDYQSMTLHFEEHLFEDQAIDVVIYADNAYVNYTLTTIDNYDKSRLAPEKDEGRNVPDNIFNRSNDRKDRIQ